MNQQQESTGNAPTFHPNSRPLTRPKSTNPSIRLTLDVSIRDGDTYQNSEAQILFWALSTHQDTLQRQLLIQVDTTERQSLIEAGATLSEPEACNELMGRLFMAVHDLATQNANDIFAAKEPGQITSDKAVQAHSEEGHLRKINDILKRSDQ